LASILSADEVFGTYRWRMDDHERRDLQAENALLRGSLYLTARALKDYHDAPHIEIESEDDIPGMEVIIPASLREKASEALEKAQADYPSRRRWGEARRIGYHRRNGVARAGRVLPATPGCLHRRNRMSDATRRRSAPPRA
jgi:hypothetical protein